MTGFRSIVFILFLFSAGIVFSQADTTTIKKANAKTLKRLGKNALLQNDPSAAISFFEAYLKKEKKDAEAVGLLAEAYMKIRDYDRAQKSYLRAYNLNKEKVPEALYYHAQMMKSNGMYDSARINFQKFKKEYRGREKVLKKQAGREAAFCDSVQKIIGGKSKVVVMHLDTNINKINIEAAPANLNDNELVFTSFRTEQKEYTYEEDTAKGKKRKLFLAKKVAGRWKFAGEFGTKFNDEDFHTGNACFSPDRQRIYFTRCKLNYMEKMVCAIYVSTKEGKEWSDPVKLPKQVNNPKYSSTMPAVAIDPVKGNEIIYFISDRKGGKGGLDIWYTTYDKKRNIYKEPKNAGTKVNSSQDEMSPFFDAETRTLFFSSNGWGGLGGFDIYKTTGDGKRWTGIENIGMSFNTGADDIFYTISTNRQEGFLVSNRKGGNAKKNATCCDDIYYYKHTQYIRVNLKGNVSEMVTARDIADATIEIYIKDKKTSERFLVKTVTTDKMGNYKTSVEPDQEYFLVVKKEDFLGTSGEVSTIGIVTSRDVIKDLELIRKPKMPIHIPNVKYQFDKSEIEEGSKIVLDTTVLRLMIANPELIIEIMAHTDNKGSESYNLKLSQKRAESVVRYLVSKGINKERLRAKGYGESTPVAPNENADGSDNPYNRARNRRTDFKIVGVLDAEIINDEAEN